MSQSSASQPALSQLAPSHTLAQSQLTRSQLTRSQRAQQTQQSSQSDSSPLRFHHSPWLPRDQIEMHKQKGFYALATGAEPKDCNEPRQRICSKDSESRSAHTSTISEQRSEQITDRHDSALAPHQQTFHQQTREATRERPTPDQSVSTPQLTSQHARTSSAGTEPTRSISISVNTSLVSSASKSSSAKPSHSSLKPANADARATSTAPKFDDTYAYVNQCLSLDEESVRSICDSTDWRARWKQLQHHHLKYCHRYPLVNVLSKDSKELVLYNDSEKCNDVLSELLMLDDIVHSRVCEYESLLARYDCQNNWSVKWTCEDCRVSHRVN